MKPEQTRIYQNSNGWQGETFMFDVNGYDWHIVTISRQKGTIYSTAQAGKYNAGTDFTGFQYVPFQDPLVKILTEQATATQAAITAAHRKALVIFDASAEEGILPRNTAEDYDANKFSNDQDDDSDDYWKNVDGWKGKDQKDPDAWKDNEPMPMPFERDYFEKNIAPIRGIAMSDDNLKQGFQFTNDVTKGGTDWSEYESDDFVREIVNQFMADVMQRIKQEKPYVDKKPDAGYSGRRYEGIDYQRTRNMDIAELAKLARIEYDAEFPEMKWSVTVERYSGGQSINARGTGYPENPYKPEFVALAQKEGLRAANERYRWQEDKYTKKYLKDESLAKSVLSRYNMDDSDSQVDYFHVRFYAHVKIDLDNWDEKLFPERAKEIEQTRKWNAEYELKRKAAAGKAKQIKEELGIIPKYAIAIYTSQWRDLGQVVLPAVITKSPNGRSRVYNSYNIRIIPPKHSKPGYKYRDFIENVNPTSVSLDEQAAKLPLEKYKARVAEIMQRELNDNFEKYHGKGIERAWKELNKKYAPPKVVKLTASKPVPQKSVATNVGMEMVKTVHTQKGYDLFVVKMSDRVDKDTYTALNAKAKSLGGWYSSFRGAGAIPGFQFKTEDAARNFMGSAAPAPQGPDPLALAIAMAEADRDRIQILKKRNP